MKSRKSSDKLFRPCPVNREVKRLQPSYELHGADLDQVKVISGAPVRSLLGALMVRAGVNK